MYSIMDIDDGRILLKMKGCRKVFTAGGKLVKFNSEGMVKLPKDTKVGVCKVNHQEQHSIRMTVNRRSLHHDAMAERYNLGEPMGVDEEEILLASLEVLETL